MKVLVTGATGFIGGYLVRRLAQEGYEIICTIRETSNTELLRDISGVSFIECDLNDGEKFSVVIKKQKPEFVFHCAAIVMEKDEEKLNRANAAVTRNVCSACLENHVIRMIYISSVAVVSGNDDSCLNDEMPYKATNAYGRSKVEAEKIAVNFRAKGLNTAIIRPCMVYGIGEPHMLSRIFSLVKKRWLPMPEIPEMESKLQLVAVENVVDVMMLAMEKEEALDGTFLVADRDILTIKQFLSMLYEYLDAGSPPVLPYWLSRFLLSWPKIKQIRKKFKDRTYDISRAQRLLGYRPAAGTPEGLRRTAREWERARM